MIPGLDQLATRLEGKLYYNETAEHQALLRAYATDASVYKELPLAVAIPRQGADLKMLIAFAATNGVTLIPRTAGTSLAGQVVGRSEEHTSEIQSLMRISFTVLFLKKKKHTRSPHPT